MISLGLRSCANLKVRPCSASMPPQFTRTREIRYEAMTHLQAMAFLIGVGGLTPEQAEESIASSNSALDADGRVKYMIKVSDEIIWYV